MRELKKINIEKIIEPEKPDRETIDTESMLELVESIKNVGLLQPILIRKIGDELYEVEAGHRRLLAVKQLNWTEIDAYVIEGDDNDLHIERAHENLIRKDLNVAEEAALVYTLVYEKNRGVEETAKLLAKSTAWVESRLDIHQYPSEIKEALKQNKITLAVARELIRCKDEIKRVDVLRAAIDYGASARTVRAWLDDHEAQTIITKEQRELVGINMRTAMPQVMMNCQCCGRQFPIDLLRHVWLDADCIAALRELGVEVRKLLLEGDQNA